ncbi:MAG: hypothetical protein ACLTJ9_10020 [Eggerthella lenta]
MKLASVILDIPTQALDAPYTYAVPEEAGDQPIEVGCAVLVPFGPRQAVGFVIGIEERAEGDWPAGLDPAKLKGIVRAVSRPYFDEEGAACAQWLSERYMRRCRRACACSRRLAACRAWCARREATGVLKSRRWGKSTNAGWCRGLRSRTSSRARTP